MSLFHKFLKTSDKVKNDSPWTDIVDEKTLQDAIKISYEKKAVIFKHSTRCGVSRMVLRKFENEMGLVKDKAVFYFLDLLAHRNLSDKISRDFGIVHQSPQMIVLENGKAVANASHENISVTLI